jgi:tetratricopeptide (TPR) repeat protein
LYAAPLPAQVLESSTLYAHAGPMASEIVSELVGRQTYIARVREAWDRIPAERFPMHEKELSARVALRSGLFRNLAVALEASRVPQVDNAAYVRLLRETGAVQPDAAAGFVLDWAMATAGRVADVAAGNGNVRLRPSRRWELVRLTSRIREWLSGIWSPRRASAVLATCAVIIVASIALRFVQRDTRDYATALKYASEGNYAEASSLLKEVAARSNNEKYRAAYRDFCVRLGLYYKQTGDLTKARAELNEALRVQPGYRLARVSLAAVEIAAKNYTHALNSIQDLIPLDEGAALLAASAYMSLNRLGDAKSLIDDALRKNPNSVPRMWSLDIS